jgi:hypothetical protein
MRKTKFEIGNHKALSDFYEYASGLVKEKRFVIRIETTKRSLDQNAMIHAMYADIAKQVEDMTLRDIRHQCKLMHGVYILRRDDPAFRELYDTGIIQHLTYEQKLSAMGILPVTSRMNKAQASEYIGEVIRYWSQEGVYITDPRDKSYAA